MRKRAQRRSKPETFEQKIDVQKTQIKKDKRSLKINKSWWIAISLVSIFLLVLFFNSYYNVSSEVAINPDGEGLNKFLLSGPDPYYNMRLVQVTYETGSYPFYSDPDPLLNYPLGRSGGRAPLFNMAALGFSRLLTPFMNEIDAIGLSMQFIPALFGALLVFPVYFIGKEVFNRKAGLIAASFIPIIAIHISSGHGSAYSLFDHDSFNLFLFFMTFLFLIKSIKAKDPMRSMLYAILAGVPLAALTMTWVQARYLYVVIAAYAIVQMVIDILTNKINKTIPRTTSIVLFSGYLLSLPVTLSSTKGIRFDIILFLCLGVLAFGMIYYILGKKKIPWTISMPAFISAGVVTLVFLYFIDSISRVISFVSPLRKISEVIFGSGIYGDKVDMTIAEANTYTISQSVMPFGPAFYWLGWTGLVFLFYLYYKNNNRRDYLFVIVLFIVTIWLTGVAGRFTNDMVPIIAILGGWVVWVIVDKIDYKQMIRNIRSAGGGFHGIRRGVKLLHVFGILFIAFLVVLPNAYIAFDAALPAVSTKNGTSNLKKDYYGEEHTGLYGLGIGKEIYWGDAFKWLNEQDRHIEDPADRPAFISWWDYGFYEVAMGGHPTVADNFQDGIPPASNFHTATSEKEAVAIWIIRLIEGNRKHNSKISQDVRDTLEKYIGVNDTNNVTKWIENPLDSPSYNDPIGQEYDRNLSKQYRVGEQWVENAFYHDITVLLVSKLDDEEITWLYHDIQDATGYSIRYYGVEGYDKQIFNIFAFLSDKSLLLVSGGGGYNPEDDFVYLKYVTQGGREYTFEELKSLTTTQLREDPIVNTNTYYKDAYYNTMFFKTYFGLDKIPENYRFKYQAPCSDMKHFYGEYLSPLSKYQYYTGIGAVVIAKYYEGAYVNGTVTFMGEPLEAQVVVTKDLTYYEGFSLPIDHDKTFTNTGGENASGDFSLIAGAGNITLHIRRYPELHSTIPWQSGDFILKSIVFNSTTDPNLYPITDDDAMRKSNNSHRFINISIDPANVRGYLYIDKDDDNVYNSSIDEPLENAKVTITGVNKLESAANGIQPTELDYTMVKEIFTDEMGHYNFSELKPGYYVMESKFDSLYLDRSLVPLPSGNISINLSKPKPATVDGTVYYDSNNNNKLDSGDKLLSNAEVEFFYNDKLVEAATTDESGYYSIELSVPGKKLLQDGSYFEINEYTVKTSKLPSYQSEATIAPEENKTTTFNISIDLATVNVTGYTTYNGQQEGNIKLDLKVDKSVKGNTAEDDLVESNNNGYYQIDMVPGYYNATVSKKEGNTLVYSYSGKLNLSAGEGDRPNEDIILTKKSVTVSGTTLYQTGSIDNVTIQFNKDNSVDDNKAISRDIISDENGDYEIELSIGSYNITAESAIFEENGQNYTYKWTGKLEIKESYITDGFDYDLDQFEKILKED